MDIDKIYELYFRDVYVYLLSITKNKEIAEDITSDTFLKALKNLDKFDGKKDIRAWLFTIAKNTYYTYAKRQKIFISKEIDVDTQDTKSCILDNVESKEQAIVIHKIIHSLKEKDKDVFNLRVFGELSFDDIGLVFGKSSGWARVTFFRAKKQIVQQMEEKNNE